MGFIAEQATIRSVRRLCRVLEVASSSYYAWRTRTRRSGPTPRPARHQAVTERIQRLHATSNGMLGRRTMQQLLRDQEHMSCSIGMVHRIMTEQRLQARRHRRHVTTTRRDAAERITIPNRYLTADGARDFESPTPGTRTVGDLTYIRTRQGFCYLYTVLDLATRAVIGWSLQAAPTTDGAIAALTMARTQGRLAPQAIFHSDRGTQYTSSRFQRWCQEATIQQSMGATGVCWDNAVAESFFASLKRDLGRHRCYRDQADARCTIVAYIEGWYNRRRPHSWNDGRPPLRAWDLATWPDDVLHET